jgi:membrane peptidoglycan carboxypeptidase
LVTFLAVTAGVFTLFVAGSVAGTAAGILTAYQYFASDLPDPRLLDGIELPASTYVYDRTGGVLLARFECENREQVEFAELPDWIVDGTVAAEDRTFWTNDGIDYQAVVRAALANVEAGAIVQGASTITAQVIKYAGSIKEANAAPSADPSAAASVDLDPGAGQPDDDPCEAPNLTFLEGRGFEDKIREFILAQQMTAAYPGREGKERILATYLNLIYYGNRSYGIKAAAANFFGNSDLSQLSLAQAAFLAGLPQLPSFYDPYQPTDNPRGPARALARRNDVLDAMLRDGYISQRERNAAAAVTWEEMDPHQVRSVLLEPHFSFRVQREAERILAAQGIANPAQAVLSGGYRITTTLDYGLQQVAKAQVFQWVNDPRLHDKNVNNGALVSIDSATGQIIAYVGSVDYYNRDDPRVDGQFDVAGLTRRQPGSAFKPITYSAAFQAREATPATFFVDAVTDYGTYTPTNANIKEHGPVLATDALRYSLNVPSVMMQYLVGVDATAAFAEKMGIASAQYFIDADPGLTLTLGSVEVNLTNFTAAYGVFAQQGELNRATTIIQIVDRFGRVVYSAAEDGPEPTAPMTPAESYLTHWILQGNTDPRLNSLWGPRAKLTDPSGARREAGFKTGTTNDYIDVSAFGYVPGGLVTGVWMGNNNSEPMSNSLGQGLFSADGPLYLWHDFMQIALNQPWDWNGQQPAPNTTFRRPSGVVMASVCRFSGMAATDNCGPTQEMPFLEGTVPPPDNVHVPNPYGGGGDHGNGGNPDASASGDAGGAGGICFDIVKEISQDGRRSQGMIDSAKRWADRFVSGALAPKGDPDRIAELGTDRVWLQIKLLRGNTSFGEPICGEYNYTPSPSPTPTPGPPNSSNPLPSISFCPPPRSQCTPAPSVAPAAGSGSPADAGSLLPIFGVPAILSAVPFVGRLRRWVASPERRAPRR